MFDSWRGHQNYSPIAQSVERLTVNQNVRGSSPRRGAKIMYNIKIFSHVIDTHESLTIFNHQFLLLEQTGLLNIADKIYICINGESSKFDSIQHLTKYHNVEIVHTNNSIEYYEYPTLNFLKKTIDNSEDCYVLYFHVKGASKNIHKPIRDWRFLLEYYNIVQYKKCIDLLDSGYDTVGILHSEGMISNWPHYSGNFWWTNSNHIKRLPELPHPNDTVIGNISTISKMPYTHDYFRYDHEAWIGCVKPWNYISLFQGDKEIEYNRINNDS